MSRVQVILIAVAIAASPAGALTPRVEEAAVAALTNLARADRSTLCAACEAIDPKTDCAAWGAPEARSPLRYAVAAAEAARFHSRHMHDAPCFQHDSCCTLERKSDGSVGCADAPCSVCMSRDECPGTGTHQRYVLLGYPEQAGENIAAGQLSPLEVTCGWMNSTGHRENILRPEFDAIGLGRYDAPSSCMPTYWTQAFGVERRPMPTGLTVAGAWVGRAGGLVAVPGGNVTAVAHVASSSALTVRAVIDGRCHDLPRTLGGPQSALHAAEATLAPGCHQIWFLATSEAGERHLFPEGGAMALGVGEASCPEPSERLTADCDGDDACTETGSVLSCFSAESGSPVGLCRPGHRVCRDGAFGRCEGAVAPAEERCNGLDDDCDGTVDEDPIELGGACETALPGSCRPGHLKCIGGGTACVQDSPRSDEICNGLDDDCDGEADDGLGEIACGEGACRRIVSACKEGNSQACPDTPTTPEICGNGLDDDCDGSADEACPCTVDSRSCFVGAASSAGKGACHSGLQRCDGGLWGPCEGQQLPEVERCNGLDDDCDGVVDEGFGRVSCGTGACAATTARCIGGVERTCVPASPVVEACNGVDDSCDGTVDEGCLCRSGTKMPCFEGDPGLSGVGVCRSGERACDDDGSGFGDCVGAVGPSDERCGNGQDDDCDGRVDEACEAEVPIAPAETGCGCAALDGLSTVVGLLAMCRRRRQTSP